MNNPHHFVAPCTERGNDPADHADDAAYGAAVKALVAQSMAAMQAQQEPEKTRLQLLLENDLKPISRPELVAASLSPRAIIPGYVYADVRLNVGAGGASKTTLALYEAVVGALGMPVWGFNVPKPIRTVLVSREDSKQILIARMREIMRALRLSEAEEDQVLDRVRIVDLSCEPFRLCLIKDDVVVPNRPDIDSLIERLIPLKPDRLIFDPAVSLGVGEARVNDSEQGLIEACRILRGALDACVELIHHTGKSNARDKSEDQYTGRGGSALPDGSRMVTVLHRYSEKDWAEATRIPLSEGEYGLIMHLPKLSYAPPQETPICIIRHGFSYKMVSKPHEPSEEQKAKERMDQLMRFIESSAAQGLFYSKADLETKAESLGLGRNQMRAAVADLRARGRVVEGRHGKRKNVLMITRLVASSGEMLSEDGEDPAQEG
jgi:RecA-family ATPase